MNKYLLLLLSILLFFASCEKDEVFTEDLNTRLSYSNDSIFFDTVFTTIGSTSRRLKIYNTNDKAILISKIKLKGGTASAFSLNINGEATDEVPLFKINGKDSINIFVKVNVNPDNQKTPFLVQDSIVIEYNNTNQIVPLIAFGQNANFITNGTISKNTVWDNELPYLIYKSLTVQEGASLSINPGTKVLFHAGATLNVKGTLLVNGKPGDSVTFAADRLESFYNDEPGQWNGIHFYPLSKDSRIDHALIKNAVVGITCDSLSSTKNPKLILSNSIVKNMEVVGFLGYKTHLAAFNNLFYNCGQYLLYGAGGGNYDLKQNTFAGYNLNFARKTSAVYFTDMISPTQIDNLVLDLQNNIIWGTNENEFTVDKKSNISTFINMIKGNILRTKDLSFQTNGNLLNIDPGFLSPTVANFQLNKNGPAINKGLDLSKDPYFSRYLNKDRKGQTRANPSDLGCYENN